MSDSMKSCGGALAFKVRQEQGESPVLHGREGSDVFKVEARHVGGHVREALVTEGQAGTAWRVASDEGLHLKGSDLAPFPFGFFNAGLQGDLFHRIARQAAARGAAIEKLEIDLANEYGLTGSFALGNARGQAEPTQIDIMIAGAASDAEMRQLLNAAVAASPAMAFLSTPLVSTFALYINGHRCGVAGVPASSAPDAVDPLRSEWRPLKQHAGERAECIEKLARREEGTPALAPPGSTTRIVRKVKGKGRLVDLSAMTEIETWLELPGMSHFLFRTDESGSARAPSGLALLSAGLAFCYLTQVARYIENMKLAVSGVRLVQYTPYASADNAVQGVAGPIDTHLFLDGEAKEETHTALLTMAARTCFLHATARAVLPPIVRVRRTR